MLEPLSALGLAANIVQLVGFGARLVSEIKDAAQFSSDSLPSNASLMDLIDEYKRLTDAINAIDQGQADLTSGERAALEASSRCRTEVDLLATEMEALKVDPSVKGLKRTFHATRKTFRTVHKTKQLQERRKALSELTSHLGMKVLLLIRERSDVSFGELNERIKCEGLKTGEDLIKLSENVLYLLQTMRANAIELRQQRIKESLSFDQMHYRRVAIVKSHEKTFHWCFDKGDSGFREWLAEGNGIFWVCGKAGSGKSTLMKFLAHDRRTRDTLREWAGGRRLVVAQHYFWYAGSHMQKSHLGMLQSLLSQVLSADMYLNSALCEERWLGGEEQMSRPWSRREVVQALQNLGLVTGIKFCSFIDGLDEYHPQHEHDELVAEVQSLAALPNVKICVSSRPWTDFVDGFKSSTPHMKLEELTKDDIVEYVKDNLHNVAAKYENCDRHFSSSIGKDLATRVTNKAEGVFLWVYLVVSALKQLMKAASRVCRLYECIDTFPAKLEDYFREFIYARINSALRNDTAQALKLACLILECDDRRLDEQQKFEDRLLKEQQELASVAEGRVRAQPVAQHTGIADIDYVLPHPPPRTDWTGDRRAELHNYGEPLHSFLPFWLLREGMESSTFATDRELCTVPRSELEEMVNITRQYLNGCCKDLLRVSPRGHDAQNYLLPSSAYGVELLHRTVYDFLSSDEMGQLLDDNIPSHFKDESFLMYVGLGCLKVIPENLSIKDSDHCGDFVKRSSGLMAVGLLRLAQEDFETSVAFQDIDNLGQQYVRLFCTCGEWESCKFALENDREMLDYLICRHLHRSARTFIDKYEANLPLNTSNNKISVDELFSSHGCTVLFVALGLCTVRKFGWNEINENFILYLLQKGFDPNFALGIPHSARSLTHHDVAETHEHGSQGTVWTSFLREWLVDVDVQHGDFDKLLQYHEVTGAKNWRLAKQLINHGADVGAMVRLGDEIRATSSIPAGKQDSDSRQATTVLQSCLPPQLWPELDAVLQAVEQKPVGLSMTSSERVPSYCYDDDSEDLESLGSFESDC